MTKMVHFDPDVEILSKVIFPKVVAQIPRKIFPKPILTYFFLSKNKLFYRFGL
jgi:hypothetical protein